MSNEIVREIVKFWDDGKTPMVSHGVDALGRIQGVRTLWFENGRLRIEKMFVDDVAHGRCVSYYPSGKIYTEQTFSNGSINGWRKVWATDGELEVVEHIQLDVKHGERVSKHPDNYHDTHSFYINGEEVVNFLCDPEEYPTTPETRLQFALKYGEAPLLYDIRETNKS